ncbi:hypothetical protein [Serratia marcescens]|uniref:hypothetical protein n=1 Tax=Serratia marcescens TaxID=615 RepID=UPI0034D5830A
MTLTTDELRQIVETDHVQCGDAAAMARELLANREAQPVALVDRRPAASGGIYWQHGGKDLPHGTELYTAPPASASAQIAGYFVRQRPEWDKRAPWTPWKEVDAASYDDIVKIIATGEAYCGWFYDTRILYDAPPAPAAQDAVDIFADQIIGTKKQVIRIPSPIKNNKYGGSSYFYADDIIKTLELQGLIVLIDF